MVRALRKTPPVDGVRVTDMSAPEDHDGEIPDGIQLTPFDEDFRRDPYATYRRLRARDPVHRDKLSFYENFWTITDYQLRGGSYWKT